MTMDYEKIRVGERILCESEGSFYEAKILEKEETEFFVHYQGWHKRYDEWIDKDELGKRVKPFSQAELNEIKKDQAQKKAEEKQRQLEAEAAKKAKTNKATTPVPASQRLPAVAIKDRPLLKKDATTRASAGAFSGTKYIAKMALPSSSITPQQLVRTTMLSSNGDSRKRKYEAVSAPSSAVSMPKGVTFVPVGSSKVNQQTPTTSYNIKRPMTVQQLLAPVQRSPTSLSNVRFYSINKPTVYQVVRAENPETSVKSNPKTTDFNSTVSNGSNKKGTDIKDSPNTSNNVKGTVVSRPKDPEPEIPRAAFREQPCSCGIPDCRMVAPFDEGPLEEPTESPTEDNDSSSAHLPEPSKLSLPFHCRVCGLAFGTKGHLDLHRLSTEGCGKMVGEVEGEVDEVEQPTAYSTQKASYVMPAKQNPTQEASAQLMNKLKEAPTRPIYIRSKTPGAPPTLISAAQNVVSVKTTPIPHQPATTLYSKIPVSNKPIYPTHDSLLCTICKKIFSTMAERNHHLSTAHMTWCHQCKTTLPQTNYAKHMEIVHPAVVLKAQQPVYMQQMLIRAQQPTLKAQQTSFRAQFAKRCSQCRNIFHSLDGFNNHLRACKEASEKDAPPRLTAVNTAQRAPRSPITCTYCALPCEDYAMLALHVLTNHQGNTVASST